jgi:hypothetical protein
MLEISQIDDQVIQKLDLYQVNSIFLKQSELEKIMVYILPIIKICNLL